MYYNRSAVGLCVGLYTRNMLPAVHACMTCFRVMEGNYDTLPYKSHHYKQSVPVNTVQYRARKHYPSKHETFSHCWFNVGPAS